MRSMNFDPSRRLVWFLILEAEGEGLVVCLPFANRRPVEFHDLQLEAAVRPAGL